MSEYFGEERRSAPERWHVGKEIPLALIFTLAVQTGGGIWWAASLSSKLDNMAGQLAEVRAEKYTAHDAEKDLRLINSRIDEVNRRLVLVETMRSVHK